MNDSLASAAADFLAHKRALGRKYQTEQATLRLLLAFAAQHGVNDLRRLTPSLLDEFLASRPRERARSFNNLVGILGWAVTQQRPPPESTSFGPDLPAGEHQGRRSRRCTIFRPIRTAWPCMIHIEPRISLKSEAPAAEPSIAVDPPSGDAFPHALAKRRAR